MKFPCRTSHVPHLSLLWIALASIVLPGQSQGTGCHPDPGKLGKAKLHYEKALSAYQNGQDEQAWKFLRIAEKTEACFADIHMLKAVLFEENKQADSAIASYRKAFSIDPEVFPSAYYDLGVLEYSTGQYEEAEKSFNLLLSHPGVSEKRKEQARMAQLRNREALALTREEIDFQPKNQGPAINTAEDEYHPSVSLDGNTLIFTRRYRKEEPVPHPEEDFFYSVRDSSGNWQPARLFPEPVNSPENEGALSISPDGRYLFFAGCNRDDGWGSCDLYAAVRKGGTWSLPFNLGETVNSIYWESQPCMSSDGKTLYFASNRPGGQGGSDLWKTELSESGTWSSPVNLGPRINTPGDENSPFLHPDGKTLYFASNGHPGLGGRDLFVCRMDENGQWGVPQNLGFPINTFGDEATLSVNAQGDTAYFSSDNLGGFGKRDIYAFALHEKARPATVSFMEGHVTDFKKRKPVPARFELISLETGLVRIESSASTEDGRFLVCLPTDEEFALNISAPGYLFYSEHIALDSRFKQEPMRKEIRLHPIESGASVILENIFYAVEQYRLEEKSIAELDKVYRFLLQHPSVRIEVGGHTDDSGPAAFNKELSQKRAQAVADYLIGRGIEASRIEAKGYGFDHPIGDNRTEEGRTKNRRTELKIL